MALEFFDGFEGGLQPEWTSFTTVIQTAASRSGTCSMDGPGGTTGIGTLTLPASAKKTVGFAFWIVPGNFGLSSEVPVQFCADAGVTTHLSLVFDSSGHLQLKRGTSGGTVLATSTQVYPTNTWRYIEMQATIDDATGRCIVRVDGVVWIDFTGDTRNAGTSVLTDTLKFSGYSSGNQRWDDLYVLNETDDTANTGRPDNDFLGDLKVEALLPNGDGASSQWLGSDGNSVQNYLLVDEVPVNTTDYVGTPTVGQRDLWAMADLPASTQTVFGVRAALYAAKSDAGAAGMKVAVRDSAGTVTLDADIPLSTTWLSYWGTMRRTKPAGGAWTATEVNALQIGVEKT